MTAAPVLLHGPVGAYELRERFGVTDERVLHAVYWHTSGHAAYLPESWAMFIADKVEPNKARKWKALKQIRRAAMKDGLEVAALYYLDLRLARARQLLLQTGMSIVEVAFACGFVSAPHFSKCYRDYFGIPPRDERRTRSSRAAGGEGAAEPPAVGRRSTP